MSLEEYANLYLQAVEEELQQAVGHTGGAGLEELRTMLAYHLGWEGEGAGPEARGKRIRPLLVLLACSATGGEYHNALPAAAAVELVHNFSLIHDDIEDNSPLRRGRPTLWQRWGIPQAINAGDALYTLAFVELLRMGSFTSPLVTTQAVKLLHESCLHLTQGQYLDLSYENRNDLQIEDYWPMVAGKTAALLAACTGLGALAAETSSKTQQAMQEFGRLLGLAFQVQDDWLGIWGKEELTGKSAVSDLVAGKKSLPVLYGLAQRGRFYERWNQGVIHPEEVNAVVSMLEAAGAKEFTQKTADQLTQQALHSLETAHPQGEAGQALQELAYLLLNRNV